MTPPRFVFLALEEHPYAREMLARITAAGHVPLCIVAERSGVADEERTKFLERLDGRPVGPPIGEQAARLDVPLLSMPKHDSRALMDVFGHEELDLVVLGGTRIIRGDVLHHPSSGVVNSHPGLLPDCRGSASPAWSVFHDIPIGSTTHLCDDGIDTGDLLLRRRVDVRRGMTYEDLCHATLLLSGQLMAEVLDAFTRGGWDDLRRPQGKSTWPTFRNAPDEVLAVVRDKLARETYAHYVD